MHFNVSNIGRVIPDLANLGVDNYQSPQSGSDIDIMVGTDMVTTDDYFLETGADDDYFLATGEADFITNSSASDPILTGGGIPPSQSEPERKGWLFLIFQIGGHGLDDDFTRMNRQLSLKGTTSAAHIVVHAESKDGRLVSYIAEDTDPEGNGLFDLLANSPVAGRHLDKPILHKDAMSSFLTESANQFPFDHVAVSFEGHSGQLRQAIPDIHAALASLVAQIGRPVDIVIFDSCFMAQVEMATEFSDVARYLVASQEGVVKFRSFPAIARMLKKDGETSPEQLAREIALNNEEFTFSAVDLEKVPVLNQAVKALGEAILGISNNKALAAIRKAVKRATAYYTEGLFEHNHFSNTIDFKGFIANMEKSRYLQRYFPAVVAACHKILWIFGKEGGGVVIAERHAHKVDQYVLDITDVRGSHGISIHQPVTPMPLRNQYTHVDNSMFSKETNWDQVIEHITSTRTPIYLVASFFSFVGGLLTTGINNLIQRVMEMREDHKR